MTVNRLLPLCVSLCWSCPPVPPSLPWQGAEPHPRSRVRSPQVLPGSHSGASPSAPLGVQGVRPRGGFRPCLASVPLGVPARCCRVRPRGQGAERPVPPPAPLRDVTGSTRPSRPGTGGAEPSHGRAWADAARDAAGSLPVSRHPPFPAGAASAAVPDPGGHRPQQAPGAAGPGVLGGADVRAGGQRGRVPALRALVQPVGRALPPRAGAAGRARGRLPTPPGALRLRGLPGLPADPGRQPGLPPLPAPGDAVAVWARAARTDGHLLAGLLGVLRVQGGAALPAGRPVPGRGGEEDGGGLRGPGPGAVRAAGAGPALPAGSAPGLRQPQRQIPLGARSRFRLDAAVSPAQGLILFPSL